MSAFGHGSFSFFFFLRKAVSGMHLQCPTVPPSLSHGLPHSFCSLPPLPSRPHSLHISAAVLAIACVAARSGSSSSSSSQDPICMVQDGEAIYRM